MSLTKQQIEAGLSGKFHVIKDSDLLLLEGSDYTQFLRIKDTINDKRGNTYLVVNTDEPYASDVAGLMEKHGHWGVPTRICRRCMAYYLKPGQIHCDPCSLEKYNTEDAHHRAKLMRDAQDIWYIPSTGDVGNKPRIVDRIDRDNVSNYQIVPKGRFPKQHDGTGGWTFNYNFLYSMSKSMATIGMEELEVVLKRLEELQFGKDKAL